MTFCVVYDACALYPASLRSLLFGIAQTDIVRARWTSQIVDECIDALLRKRGDLDASKLERTRQLMRVAAPDCLVTGYESLIESVSLPDAGDRHVLAAAIRTGAQAIVTFNIKHFPADQLAPYDIEARHPDEFVMDTIDLAPAAVGRILEMQRRALTRPAVSPEELLLSLERAGLVQSVARLRSSGR